MPEDTDTEITTTDDGAQTDEGGPKPCRRFMPIPETGTGGREMWTCLGPCNTSKKTREAFEDLGECQR